MSRGKPLDATTLDESSVKYLQSLVRMDIRKREKSLAKFQPKLDQPAEQAAMIKEEFERRLAFRRGVYDKLTRRVFT